jgi:hypothetical protein
MQPLAQVASKSKVFVPSCVKLLFIPTVMCQSSFEVATVIADAV